MNIPMPNDTFYFPILMSTGLSEPYVHNHLHFSNIILLRTDSFIQTKLRKIVKCFVGDKVVNFISFCFKTFW